MECAICQSHRVRRIGRNGILRKWLAPLFGYYPWRCSSCLRVFMLKTRGIRRKRQDAVEAQGHSQSPSCLTDSPR
jgi:hypothetical protein